MLMNDQKKEDDGWNVVGGIVSKGNVFVGIIIILVGVIFLLDNFDIMPRIFKIGKLWPLFVIVFGLFLMFSRDN